MVIDIPVFRGMRWQLDDSSAGANYASVAHNIWRRNAAFEPLRAGARMETVPNNDWRPMRSFFRHDERFIASNVHRDFVSTQTVGDKSRRLYTIGNPGESGFLLHLPKNEIPEGYPTAFDAGHRSGVPRPRLFSYGLPDPNGPDRQVTAGLRLTAAARTGSSDDFDSVQTELVYTYVNRYGEEGPPSRPSLRFYMRGDGSTIMSIDTLPSNNPDVIGMRVYSLIDGERFRVASPEVEFAGSDTLSPVPNLTALGDGGPVVNINVSTSAFADALVSEDWFAPPDGLKYLASLAGGVLAVADDHAVYTSVPNQWHAFPASNRYPVDGLILRIVRTAGGLAVLTDRGVEFLVVSAGGQLIEVGEKFPYAIADPWSLTQVDGGHAFACQDGIALIGASSGVIATDGWIDREAWRENTTPTEARTGLYDGRLILATRNPASGQPIGYAFNLQVQEITSFEVTEATLESGFWRDPRTNELGYVRNANSFSVFNRGAPYEGIWESGQIEIAGSMPLDSVAAEVDEAAAINVTVTPEYTGLSSVVRIASRRPVRMRSTSRSGAMRVKLVADKVVNRLRFASTMLEIA